MQRLTRRRRALSLGAMLVLLGSLAACSVSTSGAASQSGSTASAGSGNCNKPYDKAVLDPRPIPASLNPQQNWPPVSQQVAHDLASNWGSKSNLAPASYASLRVTPAEVKQICEKHLTAVYLDWDGVPYNQAIRSGIKQVLAALGIKLLRITNYSFNPGGLAGDLAAILPLHPDIVITGGTISPEQMSSILQPVVAAHAKLVVWGNGAKNWDIGPNQPQMALVGYDWYNLGLQLARAVHEEYPNGANLGYIHWINDVDPILLREQGFLDGLKKYPNIHVIAAGGPPNPKNANSGFSDPSGAEAYTETFLQSHPNVNVLFAPWENPPALGEAAAIKALHLTSKVHIVTMDLGEAGVYQLLHNGTITVDMAEDVYDGGRALALEAGLNAIGKETHPFVVFPTFPVTSKNALAAWTFMHGPQIPCPPKYCGS